MALKKFGDKDIFVNTMRAFPNCEFLIYNGEVIYNQIPSQSGSRNSQVRNVDTGKGFISLYEYNIDRPEVSTGRFVGSASLPDTGIIYPWISKDSARSSFTTVGQTTYNNEFQYGDILTSSYPLSASISREYIPGAPHYPPYGPNPPGRYNPYYVSMRNKLQYYGVRSPWYLPDGPGGNKDLLPASIINIPSIFYGSRLKPGTMSLKWYFSGSLIGELQDSRQNGELIQTGPTGSPGSGSVHGVVLYEEGLLLLTGSTSLETHTQIGLSTYIPQTRYPSWLFFGAGMNDGVTQVTSATSFNSASFSMTFKGQSETQVTTMLAHARRGEVNYSNNPTFLETGQSKIFLTSSHVYEENKDLKLKNFVSSSEAYYSASFERQVFVSRVAIYDRNKNLIGIATLANPVLKKESEDVSFKLKFDI